MRCSRKTLIGASDWCKFFSGVEKMVVVAVTILMVIITLNLFAYGLSLIEVQLPEQTVSAMQCVLIIVTWCVDLAIEVTEKIKAMKELKYISYDDVTQQNPNTEKGIG